MVAAARSFLDVMEELVEDRTALADVAAAVTGAATAVTDVVRGGLGARPAPWETAAWGDRPFEDDDAFEDDGAFETGFEAESAADAAGTDADDRSTVTDLRPDDGPATGPAHGPAPRPARPRVRRIAVD